MDCPALGEEAHAMSERLLLIEGEGADGSLLDLLHSWDCDFVKTADWEAARKRLADSHFDIVLADPYLPGEDGEALLLGFKAEHPQAHLIPVVEPQHEKTAKLCFNARATGYLIRPVTALDAQIVLERARKELALQRKLDFHARQLEEFNNAQALYQQLFDEVPCYISVQDKNFRLTAMNRLFKRDFGNEVGEYCYEIYKHRKTPCPDCPVAKTFQDGKRHQTEEVVTSKLGKQYNVLTWTAPLRDDNNEITQVMEMATNITEVRRLQDHLTSLGLMLGSMSHGVKGMLTALDGGIYHLETGIRRQDSERISLGFQRIQQSSARIRKMVLEILYYAKSRGLQFEATDTARLAGAIAETVRPRAERRNCDLAVDIAADVGSIEVDPNWIQQAIVNFLENSVDACADDTEKDHHRIDFTVRSKEDDAVVFEIADNGIGMDEDTRQKMFTLFFSSKGSKGTGLGLFISNHVIRQHGGEVQVASQYREGTRIRIIIPRHRQGESCIAHPLLNAAI